MLNVFACHILHKISKANRGPLSVNNHLCGLYCENSC